MTFVSCIRRASSSRGRRQLVSRGLLISLSSLAACATAGTTSQAPEEVAPAQAPDPRVGLRAGRFDAGDALWNLRLLSTTQPSEKFRDGINSDLAFTGPYVIQGNFNGFQIWDITNPGTPTLKVGHHCPASQSDVSVYRHLLFVSAEDNAARVDCGTQGVPEPVSAERLRGIRIFDISDIANPKHLADVQTCRGSHTHSVLVDPRDAENVYLYVSGSSPVRPAAELPGCVSATPDLDPNSALFRIEVIRVPVAHPERAAIVSTPRIFGNLRAPAVHGEAPEDLAAARKFADEARARGAFTGTFEGQDIVVPDRYAARMLDSIVKARQGTGAPTGADSAAFRAAVPEILARELGGDRPAGNGPRPGPTQCHDITLYPAIGLAGGACEGYGMLLDIRDPLRPSRIAAVADSNFAYWHSATFNNDGTKILFSDEWGGGGSPKCRATDRKQWGANAIFAIVNGALRFQSYYKLPAAQSSLENCVAHNGSLIPIPGRDVMVQAWYQGGISIFDWTDATRPREIAYFDRGPVDATRPSMGGSWSVYWYNGLIVSSEIARGLDILELTPSALISQNEIEAAKSVRFAYLNPQGQPRFVWPPSFALARAHVDQLERTDGLAPARIAVAREALGRAERAAGAVRQDALTVLAAQLDRDAEDAHNGAKVRILARAVRDLIVTVR